MDPEIKKRALIKSTVVGIVVAVLLFVVWFIFSVDMFFTNGGAFGGLGASASENLHYDALDNLILWLVPILELILLVYIVRTVYRRSIQNKK